MDEEDMMDFLFGESKTGARILERLNAEITQLRADLAEQKADAMKWFGVALEQKHELEQERELADGLAHDLKGLLASYQEPDKLMCCNGQMCGCRGASERDMAEHFAIEALTAHATRRNK